MAYKVNCNYCIIYISSNRQEVKEMACMLHNLIENSSKDISGSELKPFKGWINYIRVSSLMFVTFRYSQTVKTLQLHACS